MTAADDHYGAEVLSQGAMLRPKRTASAASRKNQATLPPKSGI